jgi:rhodanese-related sulfurtransferase
VSRVDDALDRARARLDRVPAEHLDAEMAAGAAVVDIRPVELRRRDGEIVGASIIERNVLEWRLDQTSAARSIELVDGQRVIIFCDEGYQSSLAAVALQELGVTGATDLIGGYQAYRALGTSRTSASAVGAQR